MSASIAILEATCEDAGEILRLQRVAYHEEAELYRDRSIPPLTQTLDDMLESFSTLVFLKAVEKGVIVGSVRASCRDHTCHIGRLMVHPRCQRRGIGSRLLRESERHFSDAECFQVFTGHKSLGNLRFYAARGYVEIDRKPVSDRLTLVYLRKKNRPNQADGRDRS